MSVTGNFFTIALMAGSRALSVKNPGLDLESEHACKQRNCIRNIYIKEVVSLVIYHVFLKIISTARILLYIYCIILQLQKKQH